MMRRMFSSFAELVHLQSEMNKLFEALQELPQSHELSDIGFTAPYDVLETPEEILVEVDVPGVAPDSIEIVVKGSFILLEGEKVKNRQAGIVAYHLMERSRGRFSRKLVLELPVDTHKAWANYERGVLALHFPRIHDRRGRTVKIPLRREE